jgi:hypothetical protein
MEAATTTTTAEVRTTPGVCPGCGRCRTCGAPAPAFEPRPVPQPHQPQPIHPPGVLPWQPAYPTWVAPYGAPGEPIVITSW